MHRPRNRKERRVLAAQLLFLGNSTFWVTRFSRLPARTVDRIRRGLRSQLVVDFETYGDEFTLHVARGGEVYAKPFHLTPR